MIGWWDCAAGASGDMCLGALVDAGVPLGLLQSAIDAVGAGRVALEVDRVQRQGVLATKVDVRTPRTPVVRTWASIRDLLERAPLDDAVRSIALDAFARLAAAEATAHRISAELVHFHEVGGMDAIADIVGSAAGLAALGLDAVGASTVALGGGMVRSDHGLLPVPAPAVLALLRGAGAPVAGGPAPYEMCTPTGAALLAATVTSWGPLPEMTLSMVGTGAGSRDLDEVPNVLRLVAGEPLGATGAAPVVLETNVDDLDPRLWAAVLARLLDAGASDAWLTPILMKKGRPAHTLSVLTSPDRADEVRRVVFTETSAIGAREHRVRKHALARDTVMVDVRGATIRVKRASLDGEVVNVQPEYDDVAAAAAVLGRPLKTVLAEAVAAAHATPATAP